MEITKMQDMTYNICDNVPVGTTGQLYDIRDGSTYTIAKFVDENCWMTQNLRLVDKTITSGDSDLKSANSPYTVPKSSSPWASSDNTRQNTYYANNTTNGAYYTFCAATAGSGQYCGSNTSTSDAPNSICPKGWKLPTNDEYNNLLTTAKIWNNSGGETKIQGSPYNFALAGYVNGSKFSGINSIGYYWVGTASGDGAYFLVIGSSNGVHTSASSVRYYGLSIRCIAK